MITVDPPVVQPSLGHIALIVGVAAHKNPTTISNNKTYKLCALAKPVKYLCAVAIYLMNQSESLKHFAVSE